MYELICENLTLGYDGKAVIEDLSFSVNKGDYVYILGDNGSGKTTLMKAILKLLPAISGSFKVNSGKIGYLPQQQSLKNDFPATVNEIVLSGALKHGLRPFYSKKEKEKAKVNMERLGISRLGSMYFSELSGGQKQKVLLARALCAADDMLFLDEPAAALDSNAASELYKILTEVNKNGTTILMISHDTNAALKYASHILNVGETCRYCTRDEYLRRK